LTVKVPLKAAVLEQGVQVEICTQLVDGALSSPSVLLDPWDTLRSLDAPGVAVAWGEVLLSPDDEADVVSTEGADPASLPPVIDGPAVDVGSATPFQANEEGGT